jgi:hypothetical protein
MCTTCKTYNSIRLLRSTPMGGGGRLTAAASQPWLMLQAQPTPPLHMHPWPTPSIQVLVSTARSPGLCLRHNVRQPRLWALIQTQRPDTERPQRRGLFPRRAARARSVMARPPLAVAAHGTRQSCCLRLAGRVSSCQYRAHSRSASPDTLSPTSEEPIIANVKGCTWSGRQPLLCPQLRQAQAQA